MTQMLRLLATGTLVAAAFQAGAQSPATAPPSSSPSEVEWRSMSGAKVAVPLPATGPMAADLASRAAPPRWADVPLPPPPALKPAPGAGGAKAPAAQEGVPPPSSSAAGATVAGVAELAAATPAPEGSAAPPGGAPGQPKVTSAVDQTGAMVSVTQDLESDKVRMAWAGAGGTLPAFEGNLGMIIMYKDMSKEAGAGAYMNGVGLSAGLKIAILTLEPPKYETRDTSWTAWRLGMGFDVGSTNVTMTNPNLPAAYRTMQASMTSQTVIFNLGFLHATGSFDGPHDWSGFAIGLDWAPSSQKTTTTVNISGAKPETSSSFNPRGFAINFESGSMASMASKMGKKAKMKLSIFVLPPVDKLPFMMNTTFGAVWY
jgi:hypothetical protein